MSWSLLVKFSYRFMLNYYKNRWSWVDMISDNHQSQGVVICVRTRWHLRAYAVCPLVLHTASDGKQKWISIRKEDSLWFVFCLYPRGCFLFVPGCEYPCVHLGKRTRWVIKEQKGHQVSPDSGEWLGLTKLIPPYAFQSSKVSPNDLAKNLA